MKITIVQKLAFFSVAILGGIGFIAWSAYKTNRKLLASEHWVQHTEQVIYQSGNVLSLAKDIETSSRGFVITGDSSFLGPLTTASGTTLAYISQLRHLTRDNPLQQQRVDSLEVYMQKRLSFARQQVEIRTRQGLQPAIRFTATKVGKNYTDKLQQFTRAIQTQEGALLVRRKKTNEESVATFNQVSLILFVLMVTFTVLLIVSLATYLVQVRDKEKKAEELVIANKELVYQNSEKANRAAELVIANKEVVVQSEEKNLLFRTNLEKEEANQVLQSTLAELQATQSQLIQSEKMASLGELTAGIAHEIQNPLNFVNNFSLVSEELVEELLEELDRGKTDESRMLALDIKINLEKIIHHGKRAEGIVKGMLQHSRTNSGLKEPTLLNSITEEYLRLAYHGLRAKDKSFNASLVTDFDENIGTLNLNPQDMGRVILNLITNAFYSVAEKKKLGEAGFEPTVTVRTKRRDNRVIITIQDNGNGVPAKILDKIFQPFFTTKPTGQGTGLGLSLSYDIVRAHGGELKVESQEGEGATFTLEIPV